MFQNPSNNSLFTEILCKAKENFGKPESAPYLSHKQLVNYARRLPPTAKDRMPTVTAFSDWIFTLSNESDRLRESALRRGMKLESKFRDHVLGEFDDDRKQRRKKHIARLTSKPYLTAEYDLEFDGTADANSDACEITTLKINGESLKGKPDLVFRERNSRNILIIELKTWRGQGTVPLPPFGWPNLKVQLWCYGMIDKWHDAPIVLLQGLVWDLRGGVHKLEPWMANDPRVHAESLELFESFGGGYSGVASTLPTTLATN